MFCLKLPIQKETAKLSSISNARDPTPTPSSLTGQGISNVPGLTQQSRAHLVSFIQHLLDEGCEAGAGAVLNTEAESWR